MITKIVEWVVIALENLLPTLNLDNSFIVKVDEAMSFFVSMLQSVSYFIPLDVFVLCISAILVVDNYSYALRFVKWVIGIVRG